MDTPDQPTSSEAKPNDETEISAFTRAQSRTNLVRSVSLGLLAAVALALIYVTFTPKQPLGLQKPLDALAYEAMAMNADESGERLYLPSEEASEIERYLQLTPNLDFTPRMLNPLPERWHPVGTSLLDYEVAKIAVIQYRRYEGTNVFFFTLAASLQDLPTASQVNLDGFIYQPYASDRLNMIAWQDRPSTLAVLIGPSSIADLASMARLGTKLSP